MSENKIIINKCSKTSYCDILSNYIQDHNNKGIVNLDVTNYINGEIRHLGLAYKKSTKDQGIMLNFCPFCGERIFEVKGLNNGTK
jgi:uncharacterized protein (DUF1015 family)